MPIRAGWSRFNSINPCGVIHHPWMKATGREELTARQWLDIAKAARDKGMIFALLTGGEPLVRKDFFEIYDGMREMGLLISINSNGSMLKGEILERFLENPPFRFNISLYGGSNEIRLLAGREECSLLQGPDGA